MYKKVVMIWRSYLNILKYYLFYYRKQPLCILLLAPTGIVFLEALLEKLDENSVGYLFLMPTTEYKDLVTHAPVLYVHSSLLWLVKGECLLSENSGVEVQWISGFKKRIHSFHAPISMMRIYPEDAFDAFNTFVAAGQHHVEEIKYLFKLRGLQEPEIINGGYLRIESIYKYSLLNKKTENRFTVLVAPSWGEENIVNTVGLALIKQLLKNGYHVIFRPHPGNEINDSLYIEEILNFASNYENFSYDSWTGLAALNEANILISDWSGIAFEYACALERPVIFVDTKPKSFSDEGLEMKCFEEYAREKVGLVVAPNDIGEIVQTVNELRNNMSSYQKMIKKNKSSLLFNCPESSGYIHNQLVKLMNLDA